MSTTRPPNHLVAQMPEPSRLRSDSLEESGSQQDRKRPRLEASNSGQLDSEEALTDSGMPESVKAPSLHSAEEIANSGNVNLHTPEQTDMAPTSASSSKVTINTRTLQQQTSPQLPSPTSSHSSSVTLPLEEPLLPTKTSNAVNGVPEMIAAHPETISISSSPTRSPEIQIAELEDIDHSPSETRWAPVTNLTNISTKQGYLPRRHVWSTFPLASRHSVRGSVGKIVPDIMRIFQEGDSTQDSSLFRDIREWLADLVRDRSRISQEDLVEEVDFWEAFPSIVEGLLRRRTSPPQHARPSDLESFFIDFAKLTLLFIQCDIHHLEAYSSEASPDMILELNSTPYVKVLNWVLQYRAIPFYEVLLSADRFNAANLVSSLIDKLAGQGPDGIVDALSTFVDRATPFLAKKPTWGATFISMVSLMSQFPLSVRERIRCGADLQYRESSQIAEIHNQLLRFFMRADSALQIAISKQLPWLTIENSPELLEKFSRALQSIAEQSEDIGREIVEQTAIDSKRTPPDASAEIIAYAWKFTILHKYITTGRMEIRVHGMDTMSVDLVNVWRIHIQRAVDSLDIPLVGYLVNFIQQTDLVKYIVGIGSHPQLIVRSGNVIGFLCVTNTYSDSDSDTIWRTVTESQDPRTISEVLHILRTILSMSNLTAILYLGQKLLDLPIERFDAKMLDFVSELLRTMQSKWYATMRQDEPVDILPFKLFIRLLRDASASSKILPGLKASLQQFSDSRLHELVRVSEINDIEKRQLWSVCVQDIALQRPSATGSLRALSAWVGRNPTDVLSQLADDFALTRLLIENIVNLVYSENLSTPDVPLMETDIGARLRTLNLLIEYVPRTISEDLSEILWLHLFASSGVAPPVRNASWDILSKVADSCKSVRNNFIDRLIEQFVPRLEPKDFDRNILAFVEQSVMYQIRFSGPTSPNSEGVISIPGIELVWRLILQAPADSIEEAAVDFVISQYLDNDMVSSQPKEFVEATHLSLLDRCVEQVMSAAQRLKSFTDGTLSGEDEPMVIVVSEHETAAEEMRFDRSLFFLRKFLHGMKCRPRYSPQPRALDIPKKSFRDRGHSKSIPYQCFGGKQKDSQVQKMSIGELNTGDELAHYIVDLTGFTEFTGISGGQKIELFGNTGTVGELGIGTGLLVIKKVIDSREKRPSSQARPISPIDSKVTDHFDELYELLNLDQRLAREVSAFLEIFPVQARVRDSILSKDLSASELFPVNKPYRSLYCAKALRTCAEDESLSSEPDLDLLAYVVKTVVATFGRLESESNESLEFLINHVLMEGLLLALRVKVDEAVSTTYILDPQSYTHYLVEILSRLQSCPTIGLVPVAVNSLIREPFAALMEGCLHNDRVGQKLRDNPRFGLLLTNLLLKDPRVEVRKAVAEVILILSGSSKPKSHLQDLRSPRLRFSTSQMNFSLTQCWAGLVDVLPHATDQPAHCQELFEVSLAVLASVSASKTISTVDLVHNFQAWIGILLGYQHTEIIGRASEDFVVAGFTKLLHTSFGNLQSAGVTIQTGEFAKALFSSFLFPDLSVPESSDLQMRVPVLRVGTREELYSLVLLLSQSQGDLNAIVASVKGLVSGDLYFEINQQNDRQTLRSEVGYAGLKNLSNTCYLNSLFSQLFMNLELRDFMFQISKGGRSGSPLITELAKVFAYMQNSFAKFVEPSEAVSCIPTYDNEQIDVSIQMDVDEFFNLLFDRLEAQVRSAEFRNKFKKFYGGQLVQQIKSRECEHISERLEPFSSIQCEIKGKVGLEDSLKAYVEGEVMQGDNKYSCTACGRHVDAVKRACLKDVPDHLIFNLKRFDFDITTMTRCKVNDEFQFPESIDMAPFTVEQLSEPESPSRSDVFELVGVLVHSGTAESGHYYSYIRERPCCRPAPSSWIQFNDADVSTFDFAGLQNSCFGGIDMNSPLQFPKAYSAYMLFYQRRTSLEKFQINYPDHSLANPVRLPLASEVEQQISHHNELFLRSYCVQDRSHARFVRSLLERMQHDERQDLNTHTSENCTLEMGLEYVQQISCRFKDMPDFEPTMKLLIHYVKQCSDCASVVGEWYLVHPSFRDTILRNPQATVRKMFAALLIESLRALKGGHKEQGIKQSQAAQRHKRYLFVLNSLIALLDELWDEMHKFPKAWNDYFEILTQITRLGVSETVALLDKGFLVKAIEIIWVEGRSDPRKLKRKYHNYVTLRDKGRIFSHTSLIGFLAAVFERVDFILSVHPDGDREHDGHFFGLSPEEHRLMTPTSHRGTPRYEWLRRLIIGRNNHLAINQIVENLAQSGAAQPYVAAALTGGLGSEQVVDAVTFLEPTLIFCSKCTNETLVRSVCKEALEGIESINSHYGKDHLEFVQTLMDAENVNAGLMQSCFYDIVWTFSGHWAPMLLMYPDNDLHHDVGQDTEELISTRLIRPLARVDHDEDPSRKECLLVYARNLVGGCVKYIRDNYVASAGEPSPLEPGQANHIEAVVIHLVDKYWPTDTAQDEQILERTRDVMNALRQRAQTAVETLSESWQDNESLAISDSDMEADIASAHFP